MKSPLLIFAALALALTPASAQSVFINELHYDNASNDQNEGVEISGPAGTNLSAYKLVFYNGANGNTYSELPLGGVIPSQGGTAFGTLFFAKAGIQNGAPDGLALIDTIASSVVQFLSYEGSFTANNGDASGEISTDIGVSEGNISPNDSLQLVGSGAVYSDFTWQAPATASPGNINAGQTFLGAGDPTITLTLMPSTFAEGTSTTATLSLFPPPSEPVLINLANADGSELSAPSSINVPVSGETTFQLSAIDDQLNDGTQSVILTATDPDGHYDPTTATALVQDIQRPTRGTAIRLATINTLNGIGARGSPEFAATLALIERLEPDVISFQEVSSSGDFFDLRNLLSDLGIPHLATTDDAFLGQSYSGGRFNTNQNLAIASHFPIISTKQINRAATDRKELTRFPLMAKIDAPGTTNDPTIVAVHYKASSDDASRYRKAIAAYRTIEALAAEGLDGATDNLFVLGDFNEDHDRFMPSSYNTANTNFGDDSNLPVTFQLGSDISGANSITIPYAQYPDHVFGDAALLTPQHRQQDGRGERTFITLGDAALDYIIHSQRVADNGNIRTEIYNSALDAAFDGSIKQGPPAPPATSFAASDHFAIIGDYELDPTPAISLSIIPAAVDEEAGAAAATGTLTLPEAPSQTITVSLGLERPDAPIALTQSTITFQPGETQKSFSIDVIDRPTAAPDRTITISASAENYSSASDSIRVFNLDPSGRILISQYTEPPSGSAPRGIEIFNCGTKAIDLQAEPIVVVQYTNGASSGNIEGGADSGILPAGGVVVLGDGTVGAYLVAEGILTAPDPPINTAVNGTHYLNGSGELVYVKEFFPYNGDDALEVQFAFGLSDVFGTIGQDPGSAWQSGGVTTTGRNLSLLADVATPSAGFSLPDLRFTNTAPGNDLSGFGLPPLADDPVKTWLQSFGLSDLAADPDHDGVANLIEFATGTDPTDPTSTNTPELSAATISHRRLTSPGRLNYQLEISTDLSSWMAASLNQISTTPNGDGTETVAFDTVPGTRTFLRLKVSLD